MLKKKIPIRGLRSNCITKNKGLCIHSILKVTSSTILQYKPVLTRFTGLAVMLVASC